MPAISILTPVWNGLPYVQEAIDSVLAQDFADWELIVSDNGSVDGTRDYLATLDDPRVRVCLQDANLGIFGNLNFLFREASAPLVHILCADDYFLPGGLQRVMTAWSSLPEDISYIRFNFGENRRGCELCRYAADNVSGIITPSSSDLLYYVFGNLPGNLSNVSVRTERVRDAGYFRENLPYAGDFEMWSRLGRQWPFLVTETEVSYVRRHEGVASNYLNKRGELVAQQRSVVDELFERVAKFHPKWLLKLHGTANYDTLQRDMAVKTLLLGRQSAYLRRVDEALPQSPSLFSLPLCWLLYCLLGGGRWGRAWIASRLLASTIK